MPATCFFRRILRLSFTIGLFLFILACKSDKNTNNGQQPQDTYQPTPEVQESIDRGVTVYNNFCAQCHLAGGGGIANTFPPVNKADWLYEKREESIHAIKYGLSGPIEVNGEAYDNLMPNLYLEDQEVVDVMNYMLTAWENTMSEPVTLEEVEGVEK